MKEVLSTAQSSGGSILSPLQNGLFSIYFEETVTGREKLDRLNSCLTSAFKCKGRCVRGQNDENEENKKRKKLEYEKGREI